MKLRNNIERAIYGAAFAQDLAEAHELSFSIKAEQRAALAALTCAEAAVCSHRLALAARKKAKLNPTTGTLGDFVRKPEPVVKTTPMQRSSRGRRTEDVDPHSAVFCDHANEVPASCPCDPDCYCRSHTCRTRGASFTGKG